MTDRELLEMSAKAAGINFVWCSAHPSIPEYPAEYPVLATKDKRPTSYGWNPLTDDGDALRLAVKLELTHRIVNGTSEAFKEKGNFSNYTSKEKIVKDPYAATRRAIVRAAAEIGKEMP